jgi:hypothetical protein
LARLFKFISDIERDLDGLKNNYIWLAPLEKLNDPFEGAFYLDRDVEIKDLIKFHTSTLSGKQLSNIDPKEEVIKRYIEQEANEKGSYEKNIIEEFILPPLLDGLEKIKKNFCVYSMSKQSEEREEYPAPLTNMTLWGHYANGLRGYCIEYDEDVLFNSIKDKAKGKNLDKGLIIYRKDDLLPVISVKDAIYDGINNTSEIENSLMKAIMSKSETPWYVENELRIIGEVEEGKYYFEPTAIKAVYIGTKMAVDDKEKLLRILKAKGCDIKLVEVSHSTWQPTYGFNYTKL